MKKFFMTLFSKATILLQDDVATRDRSLISRVTTILLLTFTVFYILFYCINHLADNGS